MLFRSQKCARYIFGKQGGGKFLYLYLALLPCGAVWKPGTIINIIDTAFALMVIPNLIAVVILAPKALGATKEYFQRY